MQRNSALKVAAAVVLGIGVPLIGWWLLRSPTWRDAKNAFEQALVGGDPGALERFYDEEELQTLKLSKSEATKIAREVLQPTFAGYTLLPIEKPPFKQGSVLSCPRPIMADGLKIQGGTYVLDGAEGPKVQFTFLAMSSIFFLQQQAYQTGRDEYFKKHSNLIAELQARGIPGHWDRGSGAIRPWVQLKRKK